jgi:hydroxypyruvate isomerase
MDAVKMLKLSANLSFLFKEVDYLSRFTEAAKAGFQAVECGTDIYQYSKGELVCAKDCAGLKVVLINAPTGNKGSYGLASIPGKEEEFKQTVAMSIDYARALHCNQIHFLAGTPAESCEREPSIWRKTYISNLCYATKQCVEFNITVLIEPISVIPGYFLQHQSEACEIIKAIEMPNLKLQFDIYHAQRMDGNITDFLKGHIDLIGHIQIAQVPGRNEPDYPGELNYCFIFKTLQDVGFEKWIGCEYVPKGKLI